MFKPIRVPFEIAVILEFFLILGSFEDSRLAYLALINGILIFGKHLFIFFVGGYIFNKTYRKVLIPSNHKQEKKLNKILYKNCFIYSKYNNIENNPAKILFDIRTHTYSNSEIVSFIMICCANHKNIFRIFVEFSQNYTSKPEDIVHTLCIIDNQIRFLTVISKMYNLKIITINRKYSENIKNIKNEKDYLINSMLYTLIKLNNLLYKQIINNNEQEIDKKVNELLEDINKRNNIWNRTI